MSARIDTAKTLTKAEKLARAMDNVRSGNRIFDRQLAAQVSNELRAQAKEIDRLTAALAEAEDHGAARMRDRAADLYDTGGPGFGNEWDTFSSFSDALRALPLHEAGVTP